MVPDGWRPSRVGDLAEIRTGGTPSRGNPAFWGGDIPWMSSGEVHLRRVRETRERITTAGMQSSNAKILPRGSVMIALNGQGKTRGMAALLDAPMACNQSLAALIVRPDSADPEWLYYAMALKYRALRNLTGDEARNGLNLSLLRAVEVLTPPLEEQRRIATVLQAADDAVAAAEAVIDQTETVKRGFVEQLLTRGMPGRHTRFKMTDIGEVPESWEVVTVESACKIVGGHAFPEAEQGSSTGELPFIKVSDMNRPGNERNIVDAANFVSA